MDKQDDGSRPTRTSKTRPGVRIGLGLAVACLLALGLGASAQSFRPYEDASGNGHDLTDTSDEFTVVDGHFDKFEDGLFTPEQSGALRANSSVFQPDSDWSFTIAHTVNATDPAEHEIAQLRDEAQDTNGDLVTLVAADSFIRLEVRRSSGGATVDYCELQATNVDGNVSVAVEVNTRALADDVLWLSAWTQRQHQGTQECLQPSIGQAETPVVELAGATQNRTVQEARFWGTADVGRTTLNETANPTTTSYAMAAEGSEDALWFMEPVTLPGEETPEENQVTVFTREEGTNLTVYAQPMNSTGHRLTPDQNLTLVVERIQTGTVETWDPTAQTFSSQHSAIEMQPVGNGNATVFTAELDRDTELGGEDVRLTAWAVLDETRDDPGDLAAGSTNAEVGEPVATMASCCQIGQLGTNLLLELLVVGVLFVLSWYNGWVFPGAVATLYVPVPLLKAHGLAPPAGFEFFVLMWALALVLWAACLKFGWLGAGAGDLQS